MAAKDPPLREGIENYLRACNEYPLLSRSEERDLTSRLESARQDLFRRCYLYQTFLMRLHEKTQRDDSDPNATIEDQFCQKKFAGLVENAHRDLTLAAFASLAVYSYKVAQGAYCSILPVISEMINEQLNLEDHMPTSREIDVAYFQESIPKCVSRYEDAQRELAQHNMRLVVSVAKRYRDRGIPFIDLIGHGNVGLMKATRSFSSEHGVRFSTYATWWIRQTITRAITDESRTIRVPSYMYNVVGDFKDKAKKYALEEGRDISPLEVAALEGAPKETLETLEHALLLLGRANLASINGNGRLASVHDEEGTREIEDKRNSEDKSEEVGILMKKMYELPERDRQVLEWRYFNELTLQEIGKKIKRSRERVRQIEREALEKLGRILAPHADAA